MIHLLLFPWVVTISVVKAANVGYWQYNNNLGTFWVHSTGQGVSIYDPVKNSIVKTLTNVTSTSYGDNVWMKDATGTKNYVYISENTATKERMHIYDTTTQVYLGNVPSTVGGKPLHTYAVPFRYEVYSHLDIASGFDVFNAASIASTPKAALAYQVGSMVHNGVASVHGKLLAETGLGNYGFQTSVWKGQLNLIDLAGKVQLAVQNVSRSTDTYMCGGTHGIGYNDPYKAVFAECSNPSSCVSPYNSPTSCTGSLWIIDATVAAWTTGTKPSPARVRLTSPALVEKYGPGFGIQGAPYDNPTFDVTLVTNPNLGWLHFIMPMSSPAATTFQNMYVEFNMANLAGAPSGVNLMPSFVVWYPKDVSVPYYTDTNPSNYFAVVGLNSNDAKSGFAIVDMAAVMTAFNTVTTNNGGAILPASAVTLVSCGPASGTGNRILERGGDYILTNVYSATSSSYKTVCVYNMRTKAMVTDVNIPSANKAVYVGNGASMASNTVVTLTASQPLIGVTAAAFKASTAMQAAFIQAVATAASIAPSSVTITGSTRRQLLQTTTVTYTVTTSNPSVTATLLSTALTSSTTATAIASALSSYGVTSASPATVSAVSSGPPTIAPIAAAKSSSSRSLSISSYALSCVALVLFASSELLHRK